MSAALFATPSCTKIFKYNCKYYYINPQQNGPRFMGQPQQSQQQGYQYMQQQGGRIQVQSGQMMAQGGGSMGNGQQRIFRQNEVRQQMPVQNGQTQYISQNNIIQNTPNVCDYF